MGIGHLRAMAITLALLASSNPYAQEALSLSTVTLAGNQVSLATTKEDNFHSFFPFL